MDANKLINISNLQTSRHPFVAAVRRMKKRLPPAILDENNPIREALFTLTGSGARGKDYGYLSCSSSYLATREHFWSAAVSLAFERAGLSPLVIPIDEFYQYGPRHMALPNKLTLLSVQARQATCSKIFTEKTLNQIPSRVTLGIEDSPRNYQKQPEVTQKTRRAMDKIKAYLQETDGDLNLTREKIKQKANISDQQANLLLATLLVCTLMEWQSLWFEGAEWFESPSYIVAPLPFHLAMMRANWGDGKSLDDYVYRQNLGAHLFPIKVELAETLGLETEPELDHDIDVERALSRVAVDPDISLYRSPHLMLFKPPHYCLAKSYKDLGLSLAEFEQQFMPALDLLIEGLHI